MMKSLLSTRTRTTYCVSISILEADTVQAFAAASASVAPTRARSVSENVVYYSISSIVLEIKLTM